MKATHQRRLSPARRKHTAHFLPDDNSLAQTARRRIELYHFQIFLLEI